MKLFFALLLLSFQANAADKVFVYETSFDLRNLVNLRTPVDYHDYGIPDSRAHTYSVRATYTFPEDVIGTMKTEVIPAGSSCVGWGVCSPVPSFKKATIEFRDSRLKVLNEIIDDATGKVIFKGESPIVFYFKRTGAPDQDLSFDGWIANENFVSFSPFPVAKLFTAETGRDALINVASFGTSLHRDDYRDLRFKIRSEGKNSFKITDYIFNENVILKDRYMTSAVVDMGYKFYGYFLKTELEKVTVRKL